MLTVTHKVLRCDWIKQGSEPPGYCEDWGSYQVLVRVWSWRGIKLWSRTVDREDIPQHVVIQLATLGSSEWRSRLFRQYGHLLPA